MMIESPSLHIFSASLAIASLRSMCRTRLTSNGFGRDVFGGDFLGQRDDAAGHLTYLSCLVQFGDVPPDRRRRCIEDLEQVLDRGELPLGKEFDDQLEALGFVHLSRPLRFAAGAGW